jgi:competence protein ComEA
MKLWTKGFSVVTLAILIGGIPVWAQQPGMGAPTSKTPATSTAPETAPATEMATPAEMKVNINTADEAALTSVKGVGKSKAKAIIAYREKNGAFKSVDELTKVKGIKEKSLAKFSDHLTVE